MPEAARLGDGSDADGGSASDATLGSPDVFVNSRAALRLDDGAADWRAAAGSSGVFINGRPAVRVGDATVHGAAAGEVIGGSGDVAFGDAVGAPAPKPRPHDRSLAVSFTDALGRPVDDVQVEVSCPHKPVTVMPVHGQVTLTGLCSSATVTAVKALQAGDWDPNATQGAPPLTVMSSPLPAGTSAASTTSSGGTTAPTGGAAAPPATSPTVHAPAPAGSSAGTKAVSVTGTTGSKGGGGTAAVQYTTVHNWIELIYRAFGHHLPTGDREMALLGVREASLAPAKAGADPTDVDHLEREASAGDYNDVSYTRMKHLRSYNDLLFAAYADKRVETKQVVDAYECTIDASATKNGKLHLPYIPEGHVIHATPGSFDNYPGHSTCLHLFHGDHPPHHKDTGSGGAKEVIAKAMSKQGVTDGGVNSTEFNTWFGAPGAAWCAIFVSWVFDHCGHPEIHTAAVNGLVTNFSNHTWGTWHSASETAQKGDIVCYSWAGIPVTDWNETHTGIVISDQGSTITAIEGNTSNPSGGSSDGVFIKSGRPKSEIIGFGRVKFAPEAPPLVPVIRWGGEGQKFPEKAAKDSTLLHHHYFKASHGKHHVDPEAKRYHRFMESFSHAANKKRIPYLVVSSRYIKTYSEWVQWIEAHPDERPSPASVLRKGGLQSVKGHGLSELYLPSYLSSQHVDKILAKLDHEKDHKKKHELHEELKHAMMKLEVTP